MRGHTAWLLASLLALPAVHAASSAAPAPASQPAPPAGSANKAGLQCGRYAFPFCQGKALQFDGGFKPRVGHGGFGGGPAGCKVERTPVIFVHGNADSALGWDSPPAAVTGYPTEPMSVYDRFLAAGYQPCELYGISYLSKSEQAAPKHNFHEPGRYETLVRFIAAVRAHTGARQVDLVTHSFGVSLALAALTWADAKTTPAEAWSSVRRFVGIAGGLRGLGACQSAGPANPLVLTCGSQNVFDAWTFGFYPDAASLLGRNAWTAATGERSLRLLPQRHAATRFYTLSAGENDQILCSLAARNLAACRDTARFEPAANVRAQLDLGTGATARDIDFDWDDRSLWTGAGGDVDGVGHFKVRNHAGAVLVRMLGSECEGKDCARDYRGPVR